MKLRADINENIIEEIKSNRQKQADRLRREKSGEKRTEKILVAMEKLDNIRRGKSDLAISRESNKGNTPVAVSRSLAAKLMANTGKTK